jgi:cytochrome c oxidase subunit 2
MHSGLVAPQGVWWKPVEKQEKVWVIIAFVWCLVLFAMMPFWHIRGGQNPSGVRSKVTASQFIERVTRFVAEYKVGDENGMPVVAPPPGSDIYMWGQMWMWYPVLKLEKGVTYTLHLSSLDLNHGFSLYPINLNLQIVPGYDYAVQVTPNEAGDYRVICNEFCGINHHNMVGKILVTEPGAKAAVQTGGKS